jgi:hypothetical protein
MDPISSDPNELRARVRTLVVDALARATQPAPALHGGVAPAPSRSLLLLFTGREAVPPDFTAQAAELSLAGWALGAVFSFSFKRFFAPDEIMRQLPQGSVLHGSSCEKELGTSIAPCLGLAMPTVSLNTAAKVARGLDDSIPSFILTTMLAQAKPVFVARSLPALAADLAAAKPNAPPAFIRTVEDHWHRLQALGVQFIDAPRLASAVTEAFHVPVNETPERLARTRPSPKRHFVTAEDVWRVAARGGSELAHPRDAVVTDHAREAAQAKGIELRPE